MITPHGLLDLLEVGTVLVFVCPALFHQCIYSLRTRRRTIHAVPVLNEADHVGSFHFLVGFPSVGERLPHGDAKTPHVAFAGEFVEEYTFWCVPLERPFTCSTSL